MSKGKLAKFADMASYPHVFEYPMGAFSNDELRMTNDECKLPVSSGSDSDSPFPIPHSSFPLRGRWREQFFHNAGPIVLELGCGRGEYAVGLARRYPDTNFIGVDIKGARMWSGATEALNLGLTNVAFLRTNIEIIDRFFAPGEVQEIWLTFSDPQMKKPTKRLTSSYFLDRYRRILTDGGLIHLKTDSRFLFTYTRHVTDVNHLPVDVCTDDLYRSTVGQATLDLSIRTYYEQQWLDRGITIKYIRFHLPAQGQLIEPDIEIEIDDYRSYKRDKRSTVTTRK